MIAPNRPTSRRRPLSTKTIRTTALLGLVAIAATVLFSTSSLAGSLTQKFFASASAVIGGSAPEANATHANHSLEFEAAAAAESATMSVARRGHTATRLADGRVLIAGGENGSGALNDSELYDPGSATFATGANIGAARADHSATLLSDGRVLIAGGRNGTGALATTEIFDPATGAFTSGPSMSVARAGHSATLFADGRVFMVGGEAGGSAELLNVAAGTSTAAGSMGVARSMHSAALLQDGRVLVVGGRDAAGNELNSGEIFDTPASLFWTIDNELTVTRARSHLRVLFDGKVQIIGGSNDGSMEIYDPLFEGFGAYAHVLPESDPCVGLASHILASQTRAALFHVGHSDPVFDRTGHTITELNGQALVLGGENGSGAVLSSSSIVANSGAAITTDKMDYAPGETATISGRGFAPGEVVRVKIHEDPHTPQERGFDVTVDGDGNFSGEYLVMEYDLDMKFIVGARGLSSGRTAQTTFTDARLNTLTVGAQSPNPVTAGNSASYLVTVGFNGNATNCTVNLTTVGLPLGAGFSFTTNPVIGSGVVNINSTLNVSTAVGTIGGSHPFTVRATTTPGCQNHPATINVPTTLVVAGNVATTTTVNNASATYGDTSVTLNATVTPASGPAINSGSMTFTVKQGLTTIGVATTDNTIVAGAASVSYALPAGTAAGPYTIEATYNPGAGFNTSSGTGTLTINKRLATWTTNPASKTYGDPDPSPLTTGSSSNFVAADNVTATYTRAAGENASPPTYHITATLSATPMSALDNYIITNDGAEFTINKRLATWTTNPAGKTYGDPDPSPLTTGSGSNFVAADNVTATYTRVTGENASPPTYHITATLSATPLAALDNYIITNDGAEFTINKRLATWTTNPAGKTYGDPDPSPLTTGSGSNFVAADNVTATYIRVAGENASPPTYHITATLSATPLAALDNYIITNDGAEFTINKRLATWTTNPAGKTYGDPDPSPLTTGSGSNFVAADNVTATYTRVTGENASPPTYHITATLSATPMSALDNYIITNDGAEFTINKRLATWTTNPAGKTYGDPDPSPLTTGSGSNFIAADNVTATYTRAAGENASPPTYHITATLSATPMSALDNYIITNDGAEFTINKRLATWTTNPAGKTYGDPDPSPLTTGSGSNFIAADNVTATYTRAAGENASPPTYHITATLSATPMSALDNYIITNDGAEFTINKRLATWTTNPAGKTYGDPDPSPLTTGSGSNFVAADNVTATYTRAAGENASPPTYHITATLSATPLAALDNYIITNDGAEFTINKRPLQVTATAGQFKIYGNPDPVFAYTITNGSLAFSDPFTGALSRVAGQNVGLYAITIGTLSVNDGNGGNNYNLSLISNNFEIKKRAITVKADPKTKTFGDPDPALTYQITIGSLAFTDSFTGALTRDPGELVGVYPIKIGTLAINDGNGGNNYTLTFVGDNLTILTACSVFNGFLPPIGGAVEKGNGGSFTDPVRAFKLNSTIPVKFNAICFGTPLVTGIHTLQAIKYSNATDSEPPIDATPTDAATTGNQFRLTGTDWHFNLSTKGLGNNGQGTWLLKATLFDGSSYSVWVSIKK